MALRMGLLLASLSFSRIMILLKANPNKTGLR